MKKPTRHQAKMLSIITVNYHSARQIEHLATTLVKQLSADSEWIIVDNSVDKAELGRLKKLKSAKIIDARDNLGFGKANNLAVESTRSQHLFFLNPDTLLEPNSLVELRTMMNKYPRATIAPKIINPDGSLQRSIYRRFPGIVYHTLEYNPFLAILLQKLFPDWHISLYSAKEHQVEQKPAHVLGAAMIMPRSTFDELHGFDDDFFLYREETDLLKRAHDAGHSIVYSPEVIVVHDAGSAGGNAVLAQLDPRYTASAYLYFKKHQAGWLWLAWILAVLGLVCSILGFGFLSVITLGKKKSYTQAVKKCSSCLGWHASHPLGLGS